MHHRRVISRALLSVLAAVLSLTSSALAQSADDTLTVMVWGNNPCMAEGVMSATLAIGGTVVEVQNGATTNEGDTSLVVTAVNAACNQWSITAQLTDFASKGTPATTFQGSTLVLHKAAAAPNPAQPTSQPAWVQYIPWTATTGMPTMPEIVTFAESDGGGTAVSDGALLTANTAQYGSPGTYTASYTMALTGVPGDVAPGDYDSVFTITAQGNG